jgi:rod shape-determining protein MreC
VARSVREGSRRDATLFVACIVLALIVRALDAGVREPIAAGLRQTLVAPLLQLQRGAERTRSAWLSYDRLTASRDSIALEAMQIDALESENARLRRLLGLGARLDWGFIPAEALHGQTIGEETTIALSAGANAGVTRRAAVVAPEGLVGRVETVDPTMSVAILWTHPQFRASAMAADGSAFGIVYPHSGDCPLADGEQLGCPERFLLELRGVQFRNTLDTGTVIYTSGIGLFPAGITIGTVLGELKTSELWSRTYLVRPAVRPPDVRSVIIMREPRAKSGVRHVWTPQRADSVARGVARAGDSIARFDRAVAAAQAAALRPDSAGAPSATTPAATPGQRVPAPSRAQTAPVRTTPPAVGASRATDSAAARAAVRLADSVAGRTGADSLQLRPPVAGGVPTRPDSIVSPPPVPVPPVVPPPTTPPPTGTGAPPPR